MPFEETEPYLAFRKTPRKASRPRSHAPRAASEGSEREAELKFSRERSSPSGRLRTRALVDGDEPHGKIHTQAQPEGYGEVDQTEVGILQVHLIGWTRAREAERRKLRLARSESRGKYFIPPRSSKDRHLLCRALRSRPTPALPKIFRPSGGRRSFLTWVLCRAWSLLRGPKSSLLYTVAWHEYCSHSLSMTVVGPQNTGPREDRTGLRYRLLLAVLGVSLLVGVLFLARWRQAAVRDAGSDSSVRAENVRDALLALAREREGGQPEVARFYRERDYEPCWTTPTALTQKGLQLIRRFPVSPAEGSLSRGAESPRLAFLWLLSDGNERFRRIGALEWNLSVKLLYLASELEHGQLDSSVALPGWHLQDEATDLEVVLEDAAKRGPEVVLRELSYSHEERTGLEKALIRYESIRDAGGWRPVPESSLGEGPLEKGTTSRAVLALRARLAVTEDLEVAESVGRPELFDASVERAVRDFQRRHGLESDGRVGPTTLSALNVPVGARLRQIRVNLERRRWLPRSFGTDYVWVNLPEYRLYAFRGGRQVLDMNVVVGKPTTETPSFADRIEYVVFNPYWNVPESIAVQELLPRYEAEPSYLPSRHYQLVDADSDPVPYSRLSAKDLETGRLRIRRLPGPFNDLGRIKFMMLNPFHIYLHDTPSRYLFSRPRRAFSHGCIRIGRPMALASYALEGQASAERIENELRATAGSKLVLAHPIPVYVVYFTAFMQDGLVQFRDDIYQRDGAVWRELQGAQARTAGARLLATIESRRIGPWLDHRRGSTGGRHLEGEKGENHASSELE
jgi:L,D-transpeptidase YcbB